MKPFLQLVAEEIASRFGDDPGKVCVVLPNRRAGLYLKKYLAGELNKTFWAPATVSVEDFIIELSGMRIIDPAALLFEFYAVYRDVQGDKAQGFDEFSEWAPVLLQDFDEIDQYLADPEKIFHYIDAARALSVWNLNETPLTAHEQSYIEFYRSFLQYYQQLRQRLSEKKLAYQGLAYRIAAENITAVADSLKWEKILIAGLNALSEAEIKIIDFLVHSGQAELFWDADKYYAASEYQEAGTFIRQHLARWPKDRQNWVGDDLLAMEKKIRIIGVPGNTGQARKAGQVTREFTTGEEQPDMTAIVLADEKLLLPVLYALPDDIGPVNVTMGYPFRLTQLRQLVNQFFQLHENSDRFSSQGKNPARVIYVNDILDILSHPYLLLFEDDNVEERNTFEGIRQKLKSKNRVLLRPAEIILSAKDLEEDGRRIVESLFSTWQNPSEGIQKLLSVIELIRDRIIGENKVKKTNNELDLEYLFHLSGLIRRVRLMLETYPFVTTARTLKRITMQLLDSSHLPFTGEPLRGLQVMGVLETRAVDFENLVVLSVNEGVLPSGKQPNSFIPFDIKSAFGLPTFQHKDAVFAYHFYRMLQRARNIYLLYDTEGDQMKGGEKSRFIMQMLYEYRKFNPGAIIEEELQLPSPPQAGQLKQVAVAKSPVIMERLMAKTVTGFSPTALNSYVRCPMQFYFQEVLGLSEAEGVEETIEARTMGTVIHQVLHKIFEPFTGKPVDAGALAERTKELEKLIDEAFSENYQEGDLEHGKNHLIYKVSLFLVNQLIRQEISRLDTGNLSILALEKQLEHTVGCRSGLKTVNVKVKGLADRIDRFDGTVRIIDYKTGTVQQAELNLKSWDRLITDPKMSKALQLLIYGWLYFKNKDEGQSGLQAGNISLRKISNGFMNVRLPDAMSIGEESMAVFEGYLIGLLEEILDPEIVFNLTDDEQICQHCAFRSICTR